MLALALALADPVRRLLDLFTGSGMDHKEAVTLAINQTAEFMQSLAKSGATSAAAAAAADSAAVPDGRTESSAASAA